MNRPLFYQELICQICREDYNSVDRIPYHLPCNRDHRLCRNCLKDLLESSNEPEVVCPDCLQAHPAICGINSFHILTPLLSIIRQRERDLWHLELVRRGVTEKDIKFSKCKRHGKPAEWFCSRCATVKLCMCCARKHANEHPSINHQWVHIREHGKATLRKQANRGISFMEKTREHPLREA